MARPKSDIRERLLRAARERFLVAGVDGASLREIARDAGTNVGMIHYYFKTKEDLFVAAVEETYSKVLAGLAAALAPELGVEARLTRAFERIGALNEEEFVVVRLVLREAFVSPERRHRLAMIAAKGHIPLLLQVLIDGHAEGVFAPDMLPQVLIFPLVSLAAFPQLMARLVGAELGTPLDGGALARQMAAFFLRGAKR